MSPRDNPAPTTSSSDRRRKRRKRKSSSSERKAAKKYKKEQKKLERRRRASARAFGSISNYVAEGERWPVVVSVKLANAGCSTSKEKRENGSLNSSVRSKRLVPKYTSTGHVYKLGRWLREHFEANLGWLVNVAQRHANFDALLQSGHGCLRLVFGGGYEMLLLLGREAQPPMDNSNAEGEIDIPKLHVALANTCNGDEVAYANLTETELVAQHGLLHGNDMLWVHAHYDAHQRRLKNIYKTCLYSIITTATTPACAAATTDVKVYRLLLADSSEHDQSQSNYSVQYVGSFGAAEDMNRSQHRRSNIKNRNPPESRTPDSTTGEAAGVVSPASPPTPTITNRKKKPTETSAFTAGEAAGAPPPIQHTSPPSTPTNATRKKKPKHSLRSPPQTPTQPLQTKTAKMAKATPPSQKEKKKKHSLKAPPPSPPVVRRFRDDKNALDTDSDKDTPQSPKEKKKKHSLKAPPPSLSNNKNDLDTEHTDTSDTDTDTAQSPQEMKKKHSLRAPPPSALQNDLDAEHTDTSDTDTDTAQSPQAMKKKHSLRAPPPLSPPAIINVNSNKDDLDTDNSDKEAAESPQEKKKPPPPPSPPAIREVNNNTNDVDTDNSDSDSDSSVEVLYTKKNENPHNSDSSSDSTSDSSVEIVATSPPAAKPTTNPTTPTAPITIITAATATASNKLKDTAAYEAELKRTKQRERSMAIQPSTRGRNADGSKGANLADNNQFGGASHSFEAYAQVLKDIIPVEKLKTLGPIELSALVAAFESHPNSLARKAMAKKTRVRARQATVEDNDANDYASAMATKPRTTTPSTTGKRNREENQEEEKESPGTPLKSVASPSRKRRRASADTKWIAEAKQLPETRWKVRHYEAMVMYKKMRGDPGRARTLPGLKEQWDERRSRASPLRVTCESESEKDN